MRKKTSIILVISLLFLLLVSPAYAKGKQKKVRIPATSADVLAELPVTLPPMPRIIEKPSDPEGNAMVIEGLDEWGVMKGEGFPDFTKGAYKCVQDATFGNAYVPVEGREDEPLTLIFPDNVPNDHIPTFLNFLPKNSKIESLRVLLRSDSTFVLSFTNGCWCTVGSNGNISSYHFSSNNIDIEANYGVDGFLTNYSCEGFDGMFDFTGNLSLTRREDGVGRVYKRIDGQWYMFQYGDGKGEIACEQPDFFKPEDCPLATFYPEESAARLAARAHALLSALPQISSAEGIRSNL